MKNTQKDKQIYRNPGFAFGVLKDRPNLVKYIPLALTGGMFAYWLWLLKRPGRTADKLGTGVALTGAISNTAERLKNGQVVDNISVDYGKGKTFFFNLADLAIWTGGMIVLLGNLLPGKKAGKAEKSE